MVNEARYLQDPFPPIPPSSKLQLPEEEFEAETFKGLEQSGTIIYLICFPNFVLKIFALKWAVDKPAYSYLGHV